MFPGWPTSPDSSAASINYLQILYPQPSRITSKLSFEVQILISSQKKLQTTLVLIVNIVIGVLHAGRIM